MGRLLGIDYGTRRVGVALSDPSGMIAQPLLTLKRRRNQRPPVGDVCRLAREHDAVGLVVGLPINPEGGASEWTAEVRRFAERVAELTGLPVHFVDERYSSVRAERAVRSSGLPKSRREEKGRVDRAAAALILQSYLDHESVD